MGRDKFENELLIKYGWPEDIWFHVNEYSSAHVYVRLPKGRGVDDLSPEMIEECSQLTKDNSKQGRKEQHVRVVYTPWSNLNKTNGMVTGEVGFHNEFLRRYYTVEKKNPDLLKYLEKTKIEKEEDFAALREARDAKERQEKRMNEKIRNAEKSKEKEEAIRMARLRCFADLVPKSTTDESNSISTLPQDEDDFL